MAAAESPSTEPKLPWPSTRDIASKNPGPSGRSHHRRICPRGGDTYLKLHRQYGPISYTVCSASCPLHAWRREFAGEPASTRRVHPAGTSDDDAHGIVDVRRLHFTFQTNRHNLIYLLFVHKFHLIYKLKITAGRKRSCSPNLFCYTALQNGRIPLYYSKVLLFLIVFP